MSDVIIYEDGSLALSATVENETVWLSQKQMAELFDKSKKTISEHINNILKRENWKKIQLSGNSGQLLPNQV